MDSSSEDEDMQPQGQEWEQWEEGGEGEDEDSEPTPSLFNPALLLPSPLAAIEHDAQKHGFDLLTFSLQVRLALEAQPCKHAEAEEGLASSLPKRLLLQVLMKNACVAYKACECVDLMRCARARAHTHTHTHTSTSRHMHTQANTYTHKQTHTHTSKHIRTH
eukprot:1160739-Pelagomonas_calceolata.AAC.6